MKFVKASLFLALCLICFTTNLLSQSHLSQQCRDTNKGSYADLVEINICGPRNSCRTNTTAVMYEIFDRTHSWRTHSPQLKSYPTITVVITTHNDEEYLEASITSVLKQSYPNLAILIMDDASNDSTDSILQRVTQQNAKVPGRSIRVIKSLIAHGTYYNKNLAMLEATTDYITFQDSDDISHVDRIMTQYLSMRNNSRLVLTMVNYVRIQIPSCALILNRGAVERPAYPSFMFNRTAIMQRVGFFDSVKMSADDEMYVRIRRMFGKNAILPIPVPYYIATQHPGSATNGIPQTKLDLGQNNLTAFLGVARAKYVQNYEAWHKSSKTLYMPFPLLTRKFPRPNEHRIVGDELTATVHVSMASTNTRASLRKSLESLVDQADYIHIYLNDYEAVPTWLNEYKGRRAKIEAVLGSSTEGNIKDNGKVYFLKRINGYHFTCDDDLIYPKDYVQRMILLLQRYNNQAVVGVHGINMTADFVRNTSLRYYEYKSRTVAHFAKPVPYESRAMILGTGTTAYHTSALSTLKYEDFPVPGMMDIWLAIYAKDHNIPMITMPREKNWVIEERPAVSIWSTGSKNDAVQTDVVRRRLIPFN